MSFKLFYLVAGLWLLVLLSGDSSSDLEGEVRAGFFILLLFLVLAVAALDQRIAIAVKQVQNPAFDIAAHNRKETRDAIGFFLAVLGMLAMVMIMHGVVRCVSSDAPLSVSCVLQGMREQIAEDFD